MRHNHPEENKTVSFTFRQWAERGKEDYLRPRLGPTLAFDPDLGDAAAFFGLAGLNPCAIFAVPWRGYGGQWLVVVAEGKVSKKFQESAAGPMKR